MTFKLEIGYKEIKELFPGEDAFEWYDTSINFILNNKSFFENFSPIKKDSEMAKYIVHCDWESSVFTGPLEHSNFPLFSMVLDMNLCLKKIKLHEIMVLTHDAYQTELVFFRDEEGIHIFLHLKHKGLWYDGNKIVFTRQVPKKSSFVVNAIEFKNALEGFISELHEYLLISHPEILKDPLVERSFGNDKYFNDIYAENTSIRWVSE
jgi:hypothetical protein